MTCTWPVITSRIAHDRYRCEDFRLVEWDWFGPVPAACVERPRYDFDLETIDQPRRGLTGARATLTGPQQ